MPENRQPTGERSTAAAGAGTIPRAPPFDATLRLLEEGYPFISNRCERLRTDVFRTRLMLRDVVCMRGPAAAALLYGHPDLTRVGAMPATALWLLQDVGSVQQLDGEAHRHRKAMFVELLMQPRAVDRLVHLFRDAWLERLTAWQSMRQVTLLPEASLILTRAVCRWAGVPLPDQNGSRTAKDLAGMIDNTGRFGPRLWIALSRRDRAERWLQQIIENVRAGRWNPGPETALHAVAFHRDPEGDMLDIRDAAVEMLNILRPVVAIGRFIVFTALELSRDELWCHLFQGGNDELIEDFVEEVRRTAPFFPFIGARAKKAIEWEGHGFPQGQWLLLDLYGTNHDPRLFKEPQEFRPQRQLSWRQQDYAFIPQGAGDTATTHRCPGEAITVEIMKESVRLLCRGMDYRVPAQDLSVRLNRIPAQPESGFIIDQVQPRR
ncbi:cytochrome P450 (plasmid) [Phyllobacteriaceae bacterium JZ32]